MWQSLFQAYFFNLLGYAICFVNYRGSLGAGTDSIEYIMGNIGDSDVKDCHAALKKCTGISVMFHTTFAMSKCLFRRLSRRHIG